MKKFLVVLAAIIISGCSHNVAKLPRVEWQTQFKVDGVSFRGLCAVNSEAAWASGSGGTFARTVDGGRSWQSGKIAGAEKIDFRDIQAFNENTAVVFGIESPAKFYKTTDGGKNWKLVYQNDSNDVFFSAASFRNSKEGIVLSDPVGGKFFIIKTNDRGDNWEKLNEQSFPKAIEGEGIFAASGSNMALPDKDKIIFVTGCTAARVFTSSDNGAGWSFVNSPLESGNGSNGIFSIAMKNEKQGIIVGGDYKKESEIGTNAAVTTDGGKSWRLIEKDKPSGFRECVVYKPGTNIALTVGPNGSDISYDGGGSWVNFSPEGFHAIAFSADGKSCWAAGRGGKIAKLVWPD
jgi:photosystem II stability/assembly factor-like uncharacterized protein